MGNQVLVPGRIVEDIEMVLDGIEIVNVKIGADLNFDYEDYKNVN